MKNIYIGSFQIHDNQQNIGYSVSIPIEGLDNPQMRLSSFPRSGEHGAIISNQLYDARLVTFRGRIYGNTLGEYNRRRRELQNAIRVVKDANSIPVAKTIKFTTMDDLALQVKGYLYDQPKIPHSNILSGTFEFTMYCPEYFLESQTEQQQSLLTSFGGGFILPVIFPIAFETKQGGSVVVTNGGDCEYFPTITLHGKLTHPIVYNQTTNKYIEINQTLLSTDQDIVIDMRNKTVLQGTTPIMDKIVIGSSWWWLEGENSDTQAAGDNMITLQTSDSSDTGQITIKYRDSYIGT